MDWRAFFNENHAIYVNARHRAAHADAVARGLAALLPPGRPRVLDWGCGEAQGAGTVAAQCTTLFLYDSAPRVLEHLRARYAAEPKIVVLDGPSLQNIPACSLDAICIVSVIQYLSRDVFDATLESLVPKLTPGGRLIVADVIPPGLSPLVDARALLAFAWRDGFLVAALFGLLRTFFSRYRTLRARLGLTQWAEADMLALLANHGIHAHRERTNIGHNAARMTFVGERDVRGRI